MLLPAGFVAGARKDGAPNLSHAWARTVDGAQGGTWEACHLLGSSALDAYRGYTGQSRSRRPTHTWNTTRVTVVDHSGILADQRDGAEQTADALARQPGTSLAARSDPWIVDRQLRDRIAEHERILSGRPPDRHDDLSSAAQELESARRQLGNLEAAAARSQGDLDGLGPFGALSRRGRDQRRQLQETRDADARRTAAAHDRYEQIAAREGRLRDHQDAYRQFETAEGWRRDDLDRLHRQLDHHWAAVAVACVRADDPLAYGIDKLRHARATLDNDRRAIDADISDDRADQWQQARQQLPQVIRQRHQAEKELADRHVHLDDATRRRWGRHDHQAIADAQAHIATAERRSEHAAAAEHELRQRLADLAEHQQRRHQHIADNAAQRHELDTTVAQIDAALDHTRPDRVAALAGDPPEHLVSRIGPGSGHTRGPGRVVPPRPLHRNRPRPKRRPQPGLDQMEPTSRPDQT